MSTLFSYWIVASGGAAGAICRFMITGRALPGLSFMGMPMGILAVNWLGSFFMGVLIGYVAHLGSQHNYSLHLLLATGFLGGLTTFSTFALEVATMMEKHANWEALVYVLLSVVGSVLLLFFGLWTTRAVLAGG